MGISGQVGVSLGPTSTAHNLKYQGIRQLRTKKS